MGAADPFFERLLVRVGRSLAPLPKPEKRGRWAHRDDKEEVGFISCGALRPQNLIMRMQAQ